MDKFDGNINAEGNNISTDINKDNENEADDSDYDLDYNPEDKENRTVISYKKKSNKKTAKIGGKINKVSEQKGQKVQKEQDNGIKSVKLKHINNINNVSFVGNMDSVSNLGKNYRIARGFNSNKYYDEMDTNGDMRYYRLKFPNKFGQNEYDEQNLIRSKGGNFRNKTRFNYKTDIKEKREMKKEDFEGENDIEKIEKMMKKMSVRDSGCSINDVKNESGYDINAQYKENSSNNRKKTNAKSSIFGDLLDWNI